MKKSGENFKDPAEIFQKIFGKYLKFGECCVSLADILITYNSSNFMDIFGENFPENL